MANFDYIRIRQLLSSAECFDACVYPENEFIIGNHYYLINDNTPYVITLFESQNDETFFSEGVHLNIHELLFATFLSLNCSVVDLGAFHDVKIDNLDFSCNSIDDLKTNKNSLLNIINSKESLKQSYSFKKIDLKYFQYYNHSITNNIIFLRVCFSLLKSSMLSIRNNLFFEESCLNVYIALEGLLRLLHDKYYPDYEFNIINIKEILEKLLEDNDGLYNILRESYTNRNSIVHPELAAQEDESVFPIYSAEEFAENSQYAWALLIYILNEDLKELKYRIDPFFYADYNPNLSR